MDNNISDFQETALASFKNVHGFKIINVDGYSKIEPPEPSMPDYVVKRIRYFTKNGISISREGINFYNCLNFVLAYDEQAQKNKFEVEGHGEWMFLNENFIEWRDTHHADRAAEIAVAILYGTCDPTNHLKRLINRRI
ncbi:hypothetical protein [Enterococcus sp. AZ177]|uniref:hypothetical protein n=1 Tax=unclassified Enterococcus TaxID=2608891 RepID=UPI003D300A93